jgi:hypothetical protein
MNGRNSSCVVLIDGRSQVISKTGEMFIVQMEPANPALYNSITLGAPRRTHSIAFETTIKFHKTPISQFV